MRKRIMFWGVMCCGLVGALLWAGPIWAQGPPFPPPRPSLQQRQVALQACNSSLTQTQGQLDTCTGNLSTCNGNLSICQMELEACHAVVFPGGWGDRPAVELYGQW